MRQSKTLPPLHGLRAFEAAARLLSFRKAGEELLISQSAVSHHVKQLEAYLGAALFVRQGRAVSLTAAGQCFYAQVSSGFATIEAGVRELCGDPALVRVSLLPSFAANWLVPRLPRFREQYPDIALDLDPTLETVDLDAAGIDLAIRYGNGNWPGIDARLLLAEQLTPVISPALATTGPRLAEPSDLLRHTLLLSRNPSDWNAWAEAFGVDLAKARTIQLVDYNVVLQAAVDGQGVAIGRAALVQDRLSRGNLIAPLRETLQQENTGYWLLSARKRPTSNGAELFQQWMISEAAQFLQTRKECV